MAQMTRKDCKDEVVLTRLVGKTEPPDGGSTGILLTGTGVDVAQLAGVIPRVTENNSARPT